MIKARMKGKRTRGKQKYIKTKHNIKLKKYKKKLKCETNNHALDKLS